MRRVPDEGSVSIIRSSRREASLKRNTIPTHILARLSALSNSIALVLRQEDAINVHFVHTVLVGTEVRFCAMRATVKQCCPASAVVYESSEKVAVVFSDQLSLGNIMGQPNPHGSWVWVSMGTGVGQIWSTHNPSKPIQMAGCCQGIPITHVPMSDEPMGHGYGYAMGMGVAILFLDATTAEETSLLDKQTIIFIETFHFPYTFYNVLLWYKL
ncbi:hypothetical protein CPC08DRAFT_722662 [Agrocybe pediades]|nr:hypothetical protein CPC08DRAFT_722662 [Agrocybe pediades]